ncbi:ATP:cob(I)alamin adenosyltransferase [Candidatus Woesearchaeota archaeon]|nr:ATP:cob(I)alamin adenosyltransferase [Candidatus Woesearchaeota archaeon]MCF7901008.1 ATP:cob(I)alamin adenosyltransferase [Candidatus Woesearchaeota archaeon]MCF8013276.1 ATP:cob(I)alamin adenosyltransferase [Candidatus Woesearchaeota archaeon]
MKVYTKIGDKGTTRTYTGKEIPKNDQIIVIGGKIDSLQASLDYAKLVLSDTEITLLIQNIQEKLWQSAGEISGEGIEKIKNPVNEEDITKLEEQIDKYNQKIDFFIRFTKETSARLNEARIRTRELEIAMTQMFREQKIRPELYKYINRLSDLIYVLACKEEKTTQK